MVKAMFFLHRRSDFTPEQFQRYSREVHVPLVARVPGLERYVINHAVANPASAAEACDGVAELWFGSMESFQAALGTPDGAAALADQANYLDTGRTYVLFVDETSVI